MKKCLICETEIARGKYCCDACRKEGARRKHQEYAKKNKAAIAKKNKDYYQNNKETIKARSRLNYSMNTDELREKSHEYYMKNHTKWNQYNLHNHQANVGTGFLGAHKSESENDEQDFIAKEMRRLGLNRR